MKQKQKKLLAAAALVVGGVVFYMGWQKSETLGAKLGSAFGTGSNEPALTMAAGAILVVVGLFMLVRNR